MCDGPFKGKEYGCQYFALQTLTNLRELFHRQVSTIHFARQRIDQCQQQDRLLLSRKLPEFAKVGIVGIGELEQFVNTGTWIGVIIKK